MQLGIQNVLRHRELKLSRCVYAPVLYIHFNAIIHFSINFG
jgi:hypothetical protein